VTDTLIVNAAVAPLSAEPRAASEQVSQALAGHRVELLEARDPWCRVRTADAYEGWIHRGYLLAIGERELARRYAMRRVSLGCTVREIDGRRRQLPVGAIVADDAFLEGGAALTPEELAERFPATPAAIAEGAYRLFQGAPYQWGGITPWGADCSGFTQTAFGLHGIHLPRDARDQAEHGAPVVGGLEALRPADLLFFSDRPDGRITHVAIALGEQRIVHLALGRGGYAVERLDDHDDPYVATLRANFRFAKRLAG
jgi:cell wall-associated NlpC family hydrolase